MFTRTKPTCALIVMLTLGIVPPLQAADSGYQQHNLVSNIQGNAANTDKNLVNAWGIAFNPNGFVWVANNGTGTSTLYDGNGVPQSLIVTIPSTGGSPTGIVFNSSSQDFVVSQAGKSGPSSFIFATEGGAIAGWAPNVDLTHAVLVVPASGAIYKGLALAANGGSHFIYATDFHNNRIDVFDKDFKQVTLSGSFSDPSIPAGFAPFGIQNLNGDLYVTYAQQDGDAEDDVAGSGLGFVNVFDANGQLIRHVASRGKLNAPWGLALAPANFGKFSNRLLVGNFGDGTINAYDVATGKFIGQLSQSNGKPLRIEGLWGLSFGNGIQSQATNVLFFTAGPDDEANGLYGRIEAIAAKSDDNSGDDNGNDSNQDTSDNP